MAIDLRGTPADGPRPAVRRAGRSRSIVASMVPTRSSPQGSGMITGTSTPASR